MSAGEEISREGFSFEGGVEGTSLGLEMGSFSEAILGMGIGVGVGEEEEEEVEVEGLRRGRLLIPKLRLGERLVGMNQSN